MNKKPEHITRKVPSLEVRAEFQPSTLNPEKRTVEMVISTGARVQRGGFFSEPWMEELSLDPAHVRTGRLDSGAPLLDSHSAYGTRSVMGVVEPGSVKIDGKTMTGTVRFAKPGIDPNADAAFEKIKDGILRNVSVGYRTHKAERVKDESSDLPVYRAVDWEPYEVSLVAIGADAGAGVREQEAKQLNECLIVETSAERAQENEMEPKKTETPAAPAAPSQDEIRAEAVKAERERAAGIRQAVRAAKLGEDVAEKLVKDGTAIDAARAFILDELAKKDDAAPTVSASRVEGGEMVGHQNVLVGVREAILNRVDPGKNQLGEHGRHFRGLSILDMGREVVESKGIKTRGMTKMEVAGLVLGMRGGMMSTSDFPDLLADVANKTLRDQYAEAPQTYQAISRRISLPDFKPIKRNQLGDAPQLTKVLAGGEFTRGSVGEGKEQFSLLTYGRVVALSRQALINDDMDAFSRIPGLFGRSARDLESDLVWAEVTNNAAMADGYNLFDTTHHGNLSGTSDAISVTSVGAARKAMRIQKGLGGKQFLSIAPRYLIVPPSKETIGEQFLSPAMVATQDSNKNPFMGRLQLIAEPRLEAASTTAWYLAADPGAIDIIEYAYLEGESGPMIETRLGFDVDGMELKCRHDFAAKVIEYRGLFKNPGA